MHTVLTFSCIITEGTQFGTQYSGMGGVAVRNHQI